MKQGSCSWKASEYSLTKEEEPSLMALAAGSLTLGHMVNSGTRFYSTFLGSGHTMEGVFPDPLG